MFRVTRGSLAFVTVVDERSLATVDYIDTLIDGSQSVTDDSLQCSACSLCSSCGGA